MTKRINISSGAKWEDVVGYSRAVKVNNIIEVSGTTAVDASGKVTGSTAYEQSVYILSKIEKTLTEAGASIKDVIRTRIYTTDISKWEEIAKAHHEYFSTVKPAATMVEVSSLISEELLVEIEVSAVIEL